MKRLFLCFFVSSILAGGILISCKKEKSCDGCINGNKPPIANAGPDQVITLPTDSILLDGSSSNDPDGTISKWLWKKISGPASFAINNASASVTVAKNLTAGLYQFELHVTDDKGLSAKDTMQVLVDDPSQPNRPPTANAGPDQTITLPTNNVTLNGSASSDPDNNITSYQWTKISGPSSFSIVNANAIQTHVPNLVQGVYEFELKVTDAGGLFSKDTMEVIVNAPACDISNRPLVNAQLIPIGILSQAREGMAVASVGNKILFAGGYTGSSATGWQYFSRVDIFDVSLNQWTSAELSQARLGMTTAVLGNKVFFAGGVVGAGIYTSRVDIYDAATNTWSTSELSSGGVEITGAAAADKVLFAGGIRGFFNYSKTVDIYNNTTNTWSTTTLNRPGDAVGMAATAIGNKIYFAGNASDWWAWDFGDITSSINIYDASSDTWSTSNLSIARGYMASIAVGTKNYWAGGLYKQPDNPFTDLVEIRDESTGISSFECLFQPNAFFSAVLKDNKIVFFTSGYNALQYWTTQPPPVMNKFDIYDITTGKWSIGVLPFNIYSSSIISVNNIIYVAGGVVNGGLSNQVWKLEF
jgi:N-acetylneuraminic acid mutarotase